YRRTDRTADAGQYAGVDQQLIDGGVDLEQAAHHQPVELLEDDDLRLDVDIEQLAGRRETAADRLRIEGVVLLGDGDPGNEIVEPGGEMVEGLLAVGPGLGDHAGDRHLLLQHVVLHQGQG